MNTKENTSNVKSVSNFAALAPAVGIVYEHMLLRVLTPAAFEVIGPLAYPTLHEEIHAVVGVAILDGHTSAEHALDNVATWMMNRSKEFDKDAMRPRFQLAVRFLRNFGFLEFDQSTVAESAKGKPIYGYRLAEKYREKRQLTLELATRFYRTYSEVVTATDKDISRKDGTGSWFGERPLAALQKLNNVKLTTVSGWSESFDNVIWNAYVAGDLDSAQSAEWNLDSQKNAIRGMDEFYLSWFFDGRGRMYSEGPWGLTSAKSNRWNLVFAEPGPIDNEAILVFIGREAGCKGDDREALRVGAKCVMENKFPSRHAEVAYLYPNRALIGVDSVASGAQILAAAVGNLLGCTATNLIGEGVSDFHSTLAAKAGVSRGIWKSFFSPYAYGQSVKTIAEEQGIPEVTVNGMKGVLEEYAPFAAFRAMIRLQLKKFEEQGIERSTEWSWVMPDGFVVNQSKYKYEWADCGLFKSMLIHTQKDDLAALDRWLVPSIIHAVDAWIAREVIRRCDFPVLLIHDNFLTYSGHMAEMKKVIVEVTRESIERNLVRDIVEQLGFEWRFTTSLDASLVTNQYMVM